MEKVDTFIRDLKERRKLETDKYKKAEIERHAEEVEMMYDIVQATENFIQTKENLAKNLNFLTLNKHSIRKVIQETETAKGLPISIEYQQQAMNLFTDGITFMNNFKDVQRILEADKSIDFSKPASDLLDCTKTVENEVRKIRLSFNQVEALHSKVDELKSTLFVDEGDNHQDLDDSVFH
ncbi:uncharacterized protein LOC117170599 [Belonocnema kinseyi]|uniref:uncharacterized protein LOC117170599 n=1 Tax=Belonocnema kinseyi TaxID=2817044 RepID=UPI00143D1DED|nr:uncharacterized protein LOC117170599 [Belonocnema kinseyi]XP_033213362.1 uncharacterized protein LOC117170599 [Belonocnema kinseyi]XP_033213363.1 uncharacterized protein LOC117170599 [Belonocnema kinseyi]